MSVKHGDTESVSDADTLKLNYKGRGNTKKVRDTHTMKLWEISDTPKAR